MKCEIHFHFSKYKIYYEKLNKSINQSIIILYEKKVSNFETHYFQNT